MGTKIGENYQGRFDSMLLLSKEIPPDTNENGAKIVPGLRQERVKKYLATTPLRIFAQLSAQLI